ncbi:MAG TPA: translation initiation factor IF-2 [Candidatus Merdimorpha stercoravium]|uniref:Translation initiation factor IF-2 n=1 Tax=Candidatus Merdimorpha stercoravium TaxID=2840863 RepID=A0A9D1HBJ0_9FLAO|nr:translation initiation factor IF-2 [Candidatus Merdimorpha stercoravium]
MAEVVKKRLNKVLTELNISMDRAVEYLAKKGIKIDPDPNAKIAPDVYQVLVQGFEQDKSKKQMIEEVNQAKREEKEKQRIAKELQMAAQAQKEEQQRTLAAEKQPQPASSPSASPAEPDVIKARSEHAVHLKTVGKIDLDAIGKPAKKAEKAPEKVQKPAEPAREKAAPAASAQQAVPVPDTPVAPAVSEPETQPKASGQIPPAPVKKEPVREVEKIETQYQKLEGPKTVGKIDLSVFEKPASSDSRKNVAAAGDANRKKRKRKRGEKVSGNDIQANNPSSGSSASSRPGSGSSRFQGQGGNAGRNRPAGGHGRAKVEHVEPSEEEISRQIKETLDKLTSQHAKNKAAKYRKEKRISRRDEAQREAQREAEESKIIKVTEYVTVSELASMMNVPVTQVIGSCMQLGIMAAMNQRLDADTLSVVADEFGFQVQFVDADLEEAVLEGEPDDEKDLRRRAPIVTVMGHVDHGKTSLLDYIRRSNVIAGEAGGITQHIAAYSVKLESGEQITFLDTPGHEAFTAMRARGAQVTDIAIIVIAADSDVMPQTREAISHAQAAGVPMVIAINKVDLPTANPDKIRESLSNMNILVEEWGGKVQSQEISAKKGIGVKDLLEKVLLEAEMLDLKANPDRNAVGTVIEASLDKGRGYVATVLVQNGTLKVGDYALSGQYSGKVRAMFDERGNKVDRALPSQPVLVLGLDGSPQAGDKFIVMDDEKEAKQIAARRMQLKREQTVRASKHITLDEIGRRIAIGDFKELNIIVKGDVDGSVEALTEALERLSTDKIHVNIIHHAVGAITESDVLLASASEAIIIGFNVRPTVNARRLSEQEQIEIRTYSIIYDAINEVKDAMEGMLAPEYKEEVVANLEVRQVYHISKVGTIAGCMVLDGKITRNTKVRVVRDGVVVFTGELESLKRFKDDVKEVSKGFECGLSIAKFNDIQEGDQIEGYQMVEVKPKL